MTFKLTFSSIFATPGIAFYWFGNYCLYFHGNGWAAIEEFYQANLMKAGNKGERDCQVGDLHPSRTFYALKQFN